MLTKSTKIRFRFWGSLSKLYHCADSYFKIFVIDQQGTTTFSRARLMNAGFLFVRENYNFDCFIFHDVDLLLETEEGLYKCSNEFPRHLSSSIGMVYHWLIYRLNFWRKIKRITRINSGFLRIHFLYEYLYVSYNHLHSHHRNGHFQKNSDFIYWWKVQDKGDCSEAMN